MYAKQTNPTLAILFLLFIPLLTYAQPTPRGVSVDKHGVMKWDDDKSEVKGFGVNYSMAFAHAYRSAKKLGVDPLKAIDEDVYHFARLGFDLYRVHVWDTEISDTLGNLLYNEHLHAFDYLLKKLQERNINYVITPIAYWGNGWPEPDQKTPGFSSHYGKGDCLTNPLAIKAQENYLYQFMNHVNPYTGVAYKDDPHLIAMEISNEPHHREAPAQVTKFIQRMVDAVRKTGYKKPIFYNISHSVHLAENYFDADIQGGTFQWYPTGLVYQKELSGNFLPNVDHYEIPFDPIIKKNKGAKLVYEFDAADIGKSYIYPAMARSFRKAGIQIATHFSYDPTFLAYANTEYNTHYMNLAYTPQKALSLKICGEVFHKIPMYKDFGKYPDNANFDVFSVNYEQDLAMMNAETKYFYTNHTDISPLNESALQHIAGYGTSPIVSYDGTGAYFLDKIDNGVWRLEVMPDALIIDNPYGRNSLDKKVNVIQWNERNMTIKLADLSSSFSITPLNDGNEYTTGVAGGTFSIKPGTYLLMRGRMASPWRASDKWGNIRLGEFNAPKASVDKTYMVHQKPEVAVEGASLTLQAKAISHESIEQVQLWVNGGFRSPPIEMKPTGPFTYGATISGEQLTRGFMSYYLVVKTAGQTRTFPADLEGTPFQWDFYAREPYRIRVLGKDQPINLFDAEIDANNLSRRWWTRNAGLFPSHSPHESEYQITLDELYRPDNENKNGKVIKDYTLRHYVNHKIDPIREQLINTQTLTVKARSLTDKAQKVQISLVTKDGTAYGKVITLTPDLEMVHIPFSDLESTQLVTMPRPYPSFLPYHFSPSKELAFDIRDIEGLQISIGPGLSNEELDGKNGIGIVSVELRN